VAHWLTRQAQWRADHFPRGFLPEPPDRPPPPIVIDITDLLRAADEVVAGMPRAVIHRVVPRPLDVEGATRRIRAILAERAQLDMREALGDDPTIADVLSVLLALLELCRLGEVTLLQRQPFGAVDVNRESTDQAA
jgi:chromatin segregation and condensation protein Rec8/ScpA/Scc1 (kleisin family)